MDKINGEGGKGQKGRGIKQQRRGEGRKLI